MSSLNQIKKESVSVILPAYNEAGSIAVAAEKSVKALKDNLYEGEVIVINDGSFDNTKAEAERVSSKYPNVRIIDHKNNEGLTNALLTGFRNAKGEIIVFLCADLQSDPEEDIPKLLNEIKNGYDVVLGWRQGRKNRIFVSKIGHLLCQLFFGVSLHDMNWIKAFKREVVNDLPLRSDWHRYIAILANAAGHKITEVKTNYYPRKHGKSKFGKKRIIISLLDLLTIKFQISFMRRPMFFFGTLGFIFLGLGIILGFGLLILVIYTSFTIQPAKAWYILLLLLFIVGLNFFSLGFLAEFMVTINEKLKSLDKSKD